MTEVVGSVTMVISRLLQLSADNQLRSDCLLSVGLVTVLSHFTCGSIL